MSGFKGLNKFTKKVNKKLDDKLHAVTKDAFGNLVRNSPVLLANFRGSWLGSAITPRIGDPNAYTGKAGVGGSVQSQRLTNAGVTKGQGPTSFEMTNLSPALKAKFGQDVFITNNIAYAQQVENRSSVLYVSANQTKVGLVK